jgi:hypothetical protein
MPHAYYEILRRANALSRKLRAGRKAMSSFFDYVGADMTAEGGDKRRQKQKQKQGGVIERLEKRLDTGERIGGYPDFMPVDRDDLRALIAVAKAARECESAVRHSSDCAIGGSRGSCDCGYTTLREALAALVEALEREIL